MTATLLTSAAAAAPVYLTPNIATGTAPVNVSFNGVTFVNQGLVGAGRLSSNLLDFNGETLGSFSGMAFDISSWGRSGNTYSGSMYTLPDRGFNSGTIFSDYAARLQRFDITFTPYTGPNLPAVPASQNQVTFSYAPGGSILLRDFNGNPTTGNNPGANTIIQDGHVLPSPAAGQLGAGKVSMDAEAVTFAKDGTFYVGDEYSGSVYHFDKTGQMIGYIDPVAAILPKDATNAVNFGADLNAVGRRTNQGMEGVSVTPDGTKLIAVLQSAALQDSTGNQQTRLNTRVLVYDISSDATPDKPVAHYVLQLPTLDRDGTGPNTDRTAAQSEVFALNDHQFLLLTRDGNGLGVDDGRPLVFKSIYLVDTATAAGGGAPTNIAGTNFENSTDAVAPGGVLSAGIKPLSTAELVNMLNPDQLARLGLSEGVVGAHPTVSTNLLSEKWESLGLVSALDPSAPNDYFLFVGNDNDFGTLTGIMSELSNATGGPTGSGAYDAGVVNDNMFLVYRVTLPTREKVPEPASLLLMGAGLGILRMMRSKKARA